MSAVLNVVICFLIVFLLAACADKPERTYQPVLQPTGTGGYYKPSMNYAQPSADELPCTVCDWDPSYTATGNYAPDSSWMYSPSHGRLGTSRSALPGFDTYTVEQQLNRERAFYGDRW